MENGKGMGEGARVSTQEIEERLIEAVAYLQDARRKPYRINRYNMIHTIVGDLNWCKGQLEAELEEEDE